jgi:hypothetical protein
MRITALLAGVCLVAGCSGSADDATSVGGTAKVTLASKTFDVDDVKLWFETGEDGYFRIEGDDAAHRHDDCLPGLGGGLALYGELPADVKSLPDLAGKELPFEFTGDGDDFNLCFVGSDGLLGVEQGTVTFNRVDGTKVSFSFSGSFIKYDGEGGESSTPITATGSGTAHVEKD